MTRKEKIEQAISNFVKGGDESDYFLSYNSLVLDIDNEWKLINNLAVVEPKKQNNIRHLDEID